MTSLPLRQLLWITLLPLGFLASCGKEGSNGGTVETKDGNVTYRGSGGSQLTAGEGVALPKDWPTDIPVVKGAKIVMATNQSQVRMLTLETEKSVSEALEYYESEMKKAGWVLDATVDLPGTSNREFTKDRQKCQITASERTENTVVQIVTTPQK